MTVKEFKDVYKDEIMYFDYATKERLTNMNEELLQELDIADIQYTITDHVVCKVFVDVGTKTLILREAIKTIVMYFYKKWVIVDDSTQQVYSNDVYYKSKGDLHYKERITDVSCSILNSVVTMIRTSGENETITFNIVSKKIDNKEND